MIYGDRRKNRLNRNPNGRDMKFFRKENHKSKKKRKKQRGPKPHARGPLSSQPGSARLAFWPTRRGRARPGLTVAREVAHGREARPVWASRPDLGRRRRGSRRWRGTRVAETEGGDGVTGRRTAVRGEPSRVGSRRFSSPAPVSAMRSSWRGRGREGERVDGIVEV